MLDFFVKHNRFSYLLMVALVGLGLYSVNEIPKESAPSIEVPVGIVTTILPGAAALDVESLVTNEIESGLDGNLDDVAEISSVSREGVSSITVEFGTEADLDESIQSLRDEIERIQSNLPDAAEDPSVTQIDFVDQPIFTFAVAGDRSDQEFIAVADQIEAALTTVAGVSDIERTGIQPREVHVVLDQAALQQYSLTIQEIINGLRSANTAFPVGEIVQDNIGYNIVVEGTVDDTAAVADTPIASRGGQPIYIRDVATVIDGVAVQSNFSRLSIAGAPSERSIGFDVYKRTGSDITVITPELQRVLDELPTTNPELADLDFYVIQDAGELIINDLVQLTTSGLQTALLVTLLLVVAIGWREALIAGSAIPLSFTIGFIGLYLSGNTINFISLFALILGIGILVDSSIVMIEGINKRLKDNPDVDKTQAAIWTIQAYHKPVIAGTLTTVAMFSGLFIVSGVTGEFISSIPFTLIFVLLASLLVAIGFIPLLASSVLRRRNRSAIEQKQVAYANALEQWYSRTMYRLLQNRRQKRLFVGALFVGFASAIALIPLGIVSVTFFGAGDADNVFIEARLPSGSTLTTTDQTVRAIEETLYQTDDIAAFRSSVGTGNAFLEGGTSGANIASLTLSLDETRERSSLAIIEELRRELATIPNADITVSQPDAGPPTGAPISITVQGTDINDLGETARSIEQLLQNREDLTNVAADTSDGNSEFVFTIANEEATALGFSAQSISQTLRTAVVGTEATTINSIDDEIPITVRLGLNDNPTNINQLNHSNIQVLENLLVTAPNGEQVILGSLFDTSLQEARNSITHRDRERVITVNADTVGGANPRELSGELDAMIINELTIPDGISISFGGENEESDQAFQELFLALIVGITLMIAVLVLQFNSYRYPLYVLSIVPFSLIGILYGLAITGSALSFPSIMGFVALTGIVVNNSILLIDMINTYRKEQPYRPTRAAIVEASASRLRPILLTTLTTVLGITPLLFTDPIWVPLATAIMFGLSFSVVITLILIPVLYDSYPGKLR